MAGEFAVTTRPLKSVARQYNEMYRSLLNYQTNIEVLKGQIDSDTYSNVAKVLKDVISNQAAVARSLKDLETGLREIIDVYSDTERKILGDKAGCISLKDLVVEFCEKNDIDIGEVGGDVLLRMCDSGGSFSAQWTPYMDVFMSAFGKGEVGPEIFTQVLGSTANLFAFAGKVVEKKPNETILKIIRKEAGFTKYFNEEAKISKNFWKNLGEELKEEVTGYKDFKNITKGAKAVAKWAGAATTFVSNTAENVEEYKSGKISKGRAWAETFIETGTDVVIDTGAMAGTTAAAGSLAALGIVSAPTLVIGGVAAAGVIGANWICESVTGKDIGENVADFICDKVGGIKKGKTKKSK